MKRKRIYFDHNATTPVHPAAREAMLPFLGERFGNPSSAHWAGRDVKASEEEARGKVARLIGAEPSRIVFTAGGTEGDNMAIKGILLKNIKKGGHVITSAVEHPAVLRTCKAMEAFGFETSLVGVDGAGMLDPDDIRRAIRKDTLLISVMFANNETGNIYPVKEIARVAHDHGITFHTDAVQAVGKIPVDVKELGIDILSASGHKFNSPKGVGFQYVGEGVEMLPLLEGGHQEHGLRAGTENIPGIVAIGEACQAALETMEQKRLHIGRLRDMMEEAVLERIPETLVNGHRGKRIYNTSNLSFKYIESEALLSLLNIEGIAVSGGSACASGEPSHVLRAMGLDPLCLRGAVRISLGLGNTQEEADYFIQRVVPLVERLRAMSPLY